MSKYNRKSHGEWKAVCKQNNFQWRRTLTPNHNNPADMLKLPQISLAAHSSFWTAACCFTGWIGFRLVCRGNTQIEQLEFSHRRWTAGCEQEPSALIVPCLRASSLPPVTTAPGAKQRRLWASLVCGFIVKSRSRFWSRESLRVIAAIFSFWFLSDLLITAATPLLLWCSFLPSLSPSIKRLLVAFSLA